MNRFRWHILLWLAGILTAAPGVWAQPGQFGPREPHVAYVYPAGGQQGDYFQVTIGGQHLDSATKAYFSGEGVDARVVKYSKPLSEEEATDLREKLREKLRRVYEETFFLENPKQAALRVGKEMGVDAEDLMALDQYDEAHSDPKRQPNPQLAETVVLQVRIAPNAKLGERELRLRTSSGLSNPLRFHVGEFPEYVEGERNDKTGDTGNGKRLPIIVNGQIMPGDIDRFRLKAPKGMRLVVAASARKLIPNLADAVPGWLQATLALYDANGNEVAYVDDYRFDPDPVLYYEIPEDGLYTLEIKDAIYRGREDFVYRITLGEIPFVTSVFPMGGRTDSRIDVELNGWNLPVEKLTLDTKGRSPDVHPIVILKGQRVTNHVPFAVDTLPDCLEAEPNNEPGSAQQLRPPLIVNGRIDRPGDWDVFRFYCRAGGMIFAEVKARRLNSPVDSVLMLTDEKGRQIEVNDDHEDKAAGLTTHHADSRLRVTIPADGFYYLHLGDTQRKGGTAYGYRLHINAQRPDFELRIVPPSINARAGTSVPITIHALRRDGFSDAIALSLVDAPPGFVLSGGWVPAGEESVRLMLTVPPAPTKEPISLRLAGRAMINGREIRRPAIPAEDMMQAFIYHHLIPARDLMVSVTGRAFGLSDGILAHP
ncbi:MAG: peptidase [Pirellulaceae bacterium]|nr:peptidase [Pirellulaceae bacterium]